MVSRCVGFGDRAAACMNLGLKKEEKNFRARLKGFPHTFLLENDEDGLKGPKVCLKLVDIQQADLAAGLSTPLEVARCHNLLSYLYYSLGDVTQAQQHADKALEQKGEENNLVSLANKAVILWRYDRDTATQLASKLDSMKEAADSLKKGNTQSAQSISDFETRWHIEESVAFSASKSSSIVEVDFQYLIIKANAELAFTYSRLSGHRHSCKAVEIFTNVLTQAREPEKWLWQFGLAMTRRRLIHMNSTNPLVTDKEDEELLTIIRLFKEVITKCSYENLKAMCYAEIANVLFSRQSHKTEKFVQKVKVLLDQDEAACARADWRVDVSNRFSMQDRWQKPFDPLFNQILFEVCDKALRLGRQEPSVLWKVAKIFRYRNCLEEAVALLEKSVEIRPTSTEYHQLGLTYKALAKRASQEKRYETHPRHDSRDSQRRDSRESFQRRDSRDSFYRCDSQYSRGRGHDRGRGRAGSWRPSSNDVCQSANSTLGYSDCDAKYPSKRGYRGPHLTNRAVSSRGQACGRQGGKLSYSTNQRQGQFAENPQSHKEQTDLFRKKSGFARTSHSIDEVQLDVMGLRSNHLQSVQDQNASSTLPHIYTNISASNCMDEVSSLNPNAKEFKPISGSYSKLVNKQTNKYNPASVLYESEDRQTMAMADDGAAGGDSTLQRLDHSLSQDSGFFAGSSDFSTQFSCLSINSEGDNYTTGFVYSDLVSQQQLKESTTKEDLAPQYSIGKEKTVVSNPVSPNFSLETPMYECGWTSNPPETPTKQEINTMKKIVKSPYIITKYCPSDKNVVKALNAFEKSVELSQETNTRAIYECALMYRGLEKNDRALKMIELIINDINHVFGPFDKISAYEQAGFIKKDLCEAELDSKKKEQMKLESDSFLRMALLMCSRLCRWLPRFQPFIKEVWKAFPLLMKSVNDRACKTSEKDKEKAKLFQLIKENIKSNVCLQALLEADEKEATNPDFLWLKIKNCVDLQKYREALDIYSFQGLVGRQVEDDDYYGFCRICVLAAKDALTMSTIEDKLRDARECFLMAFNNFVFSSQRKLDDASGEEWTSTCDESDSEDEEDIVDLMLVHDLQSSTSTKARELQQVLGHVCGLRVKTCLQDDYIFGDLYLKSVSQAIKKCRVPLVLAGAKKSSEEFKLLVALVAKRQLLRVLLVDGDHVPALINRPSVPKLMCPQVLLRDKSGLALNTVHATDTQSPVDYTVSTPTAVAGSDNAQAPGCTIIVAESHPPAQAGLFNKTVDHADLWHKYNDPAIFDGICQLICFLINLTL